MPSVVTSVTGDIMVLSCSCMRVSVCASRNIVKTISCGVFEAVMRYGTEINVSQFGVKRSKVKVMVE